MKRSYRTFFVWPKKRWKNLLVGILLTGITLACIDLALLPSGTEYVRKNPRITALMEQRMKERERSGNAASMQWHWVPISSISPHLIRAVIAGEDAAFFSHAGFDPSAWGEALQEAWQDFKIPRGASTISQQLAKNLYLSESKNPWRKVKELVVTRRLERALSKRRILEIYLNVIEWGEGVFGAEAAARTYFRRPASALSQTEAAFLAAMIPNPRTRYNPLKNPRGVRARQQIIMRRMGSVKIPFS